MLTPPGSSVFAKAYAKINLRLRILAREASGYHSIETIFQRLELADDVHVSLRNDGQRTLSCSVDVGPEHENLAFRAAEAYLARSGWNTGIAIDIVKRIPARGGLGGGSADAAATLRALNALNPSPLSPTSLLDIAATLGADVPFMATDAPLALAWGRGERMLALDALPQRWVALTIPDFGVSTADAYRWVAESRVTRTASSSATVLHPWHLANWSELAQRSDNDFTPVVAEHHPEIATLLSTLRAAGPLWAEMSGSGSTLYAIFESEPDAAALERATKAKIIVTKTAEAVEAERRID